MVLEDWNPLLFPTLTGEKVFYRGAEINLSRWFEIYKDEELFIWALPEKDYGEPRYPNYPKNWNIFRDAPTREKMENEFIEIYVHYAKILVAYNNQNLLNFRTQGQYLTANLSTVWLTMAPKYKMLRREFVALHEAIKPRLQEALNKAFKNPDKEDVTAIRIKGNPFGRAVKKALEHLQGRKLNEKFGYGCFPSFDDDYHTYVQQMINDFRKKGGVIFSSERKMAESEIFKFLKDNGLIKTTGYEEFELTDKGKKSVIELIL